MTEKTQNDRERKRQQIRERYSQARPDNIQHTPANQILNVNDNEMHQNVAIYARVSTGNDQQLSSLTMQKNYYTEIVNDHDNWTLVDIYADEGISGTSL
ncbi:MAG: recombinase family protein, partial [Oscillospiraceae bacterium]|nr:recombinase family protein [Oscillospiraceae bacterium]